jgi:predicted DNA-binding transcriptional regulator YafY
MRNTVPSKKPRISPLHQRSNRLDGPSFLKRAILFQAELQRSRFPNASTLATLSRCSRSTAMRTIDRLRYEFGLPLGYDESRRGYFLIDHNTSLVSLPPSRSELLALALLSQLARSIDGGALGEAVTALWARATSGRALDAHELEVLRDRICVELGATPRLEWGTLVDLLSLCESDTLVTLRYRSPWRARHTHEYVGCVERIKFSDGAVFVLFRRLAEAQIVLNAAFISDVTRMDGTAPRPGACPGEPHNEDEAWFAGNGHWSGEHEEVVEVAIPAPAAAFYAAQIWHPEQVDRWEGETLVRKFPACLTLELARRLLALGRSLKSVKPERLLDQIRLDVAHLLRVCGG